MKYTIILLTVILFATTGCLSPEMRSAKIALNEKEYDRAIENLEREIQRMPGNAEVWFLKGYSYEKLNDWINMSESYVQSKEISDQFQEEIDFSISKLVSRYYKRSMMYFDSSNWDTALIYLDTAIIIDEGNYRTYRLAAITAYRGEMDENAINFCIAAIEREPSIAEARAEMEENENITSPDYNMESRRVLIDTYNKNKDWDKVIEWSDKIMDRVEETDGDPNDYLSAHDAIISAYEALEQNEKAEQVILKAMEKFPDNLQLRLNLATYKTHREDYQGAIEVLKGVLLINPDNVYANFTIGTIYMMGKNYKEAINYLAKVIAEEAENVLALQYLFSAYYHTDQNEKGSEIKKRWEKVK
jgi:tetratricopeptide (TPR) repeat protein